MRPARRIRLATLGLAAVLSAGQASGQEALQFPSPILTLDQEALYNGSLAAERISEEIERRGDELAAENREIEARLVAEELELTEMRPTMDPEAFGQLADAFDEKVQRLRAEQDAKTRELQRLRDRERQTFLRRISPILGEIVRERGAVVVLDRRSVFLSAESIDITQEAIDRINAAFEEDEALPGPDAPEPEPPAPVPTAPGDPGQPPSPVDP